MITFIRRRFFYVAILLGALCVTPIASFAQIAVGVSIHVAPPALPVYTQPPCPTPGYLWTPGYWAYGAAGYYWVPGVWVAPPRVGVLWTPPYWGFVGGVYVFHAGYWGPHVGFYGGINYGFGYSGVGFGGGVWAGNVFRYNTAVVNVNTAVIHNTYVNRTVINNTVVNHTSFSGPGGIPAQPTPQERMAMNEQHLQPTVNQLSHQQTASQDRSQWASSNGGRPATAAMNTVNGRRYDQQGRIANGVASGQLTADETKHLENREANLNSTIHNDRQANGGSLTSQERQNINQRQNNISNSIYDDKHNGATQTYGNNEVGQRRYDQQQRLAQGIASGQTPAAGAARTEQREHNINRSIAADRAANGGRLTQQERQNINRRQNGASRQIYRQKHNAAHAPR
ncbi:YXWGXW repeat-containing protein [Tunturibacter empetritectus]|uniref:YXWGXW repeat-containing protein n=1 Tax=Tunturiibacter lichenicola TaxID=2051959 RepID=A0A7W8J6D6_9BACT|nr:YXWGXW repeat-containing protein [Edaphobacter lichenicola]MBB5343390.1 hypothetical protein [Edaphobacter lichenicola]